MKDLSLHILDIVENSVKAESKNIEISINENINADRLTLCIKDDGNGIKKEMLNSVSDPFVTTKKNKRIGLGLSLLKQAAEIANGNFNIRSIENSGTRIEATFQLSHIDRKPIGDIAETFISAILLGPNTEFILKYKKNGSDFTIKTKDLKEQIGINTLTNTNILKELKALINSKLQGFDPAEKNYRSENGR
jgi:hypothetical protein